MFVVPGSIYSPNSAGTNALLREGRAKAVCKPGDLSGVLGLRGAAAPAAVTAAAARAVAVRAAEDAVMAVGSN